EGMNHNFMYEDGLYNRKRNGVYNAKEIHEDLEEYKAREIEREEWQEKEQVRESKAGSWQYKGKNKGKKKRTAEDSETEAVKAWRRRHAKREGYYELKATTYDPTYINPEDGTVGGYRRYYLPENQIQIFLKDSVTELVANWANQEPLYKINMYGGAMILMEK